MTYTSRSMRRRRGTDKWETTLSYKNPVTGAVEPSYHTITASTEARARKERDKLIREINEKGSAVATSETIRDLLETFIEHKVKSGGIEASTATCYRKDARKIITTNWLHPGIEPLIAPAKLRK